MGDIASKEIYENIQLPRSPKGKVIPFQTLYNDCKIVSDITQTKEWNEVWKNFYDFTDDELSIDIHESLEEINAYSADKQVEEIIKCANNFAYFAHKYFKIQHPTKGALPFILFKYQRRVIDDYHNHRFNILSKFRQGGLTTVSVAWAVWRCLFKLDQKILVMSKTDREAITAGEVAKFGMQELPEWMKPHMGKSNEHERQFKDTGSILWFYTPEAARGKSITVLIIDEAAFIPDMHKHWKAMYPVISTGGQCCVISTVNGLGNWYEEIYHEAEAGDNPFNVIDLDYWEHPEYIDPDWVKDTKANLGDKGWKQEVLRSFLGSGQTYISPKIIGELDIFTRDNEPLRIAFEKWVNPGEERKVSWEPGALWIFKEPIDGHEYLISVDCAEGVGEDGDNSAFQVLDIATLEQVAEFYSNTVPAHIYAQITNEIGYYYNTAIIVIETNQGGAVMSTLQHDLSYENLYYEPKGRQQNPGIKVSKSNRSVILESLQHRLINGSLRINSRRLVNEFKTFIFNPQTKRAEAQKGKHDDAIMAMAIGLYVRDSQTRGMPIGAEEPAEIVQLFKSEVYEEIKQEILNGSPEDWIEDTDYDPIFNLADDDESLGSSFSARRKNDKLLKEFGW